MSRPARCAVTRKKPERCACNRKSGCVYRGLPVTRYMDTKWKVVAA